MLIVGLLLIALGVGVVVAAVFTAEISGGDLDVIGIGLSPAALFLLGLVAGLCILLGLLVSKAGVRSEWRQRKEQKKYRQLSEKLDHAEAERRRDLDGNDRRAI